MLRHPLRSCLAALTFTAASASSTPAQELIPEHLTNLRYRHIGPGRQPDLGGPWRDR